MASNSFVERNDGRFMVISYPDDQSAGDIVHLKTDAEVRKHLDRIRSLKMAERVDVFIYMAGRYRLVEIRHLKEAD